MLFSLVLACTSQKTTTADGNPKFHGTIPSEKIALPEFKALNSDGAERTKEDLTGHPTVIWFYPRAGTPG